MVSRRAMLGISVGALLAGGAAQAQQRRSMADPLRLGVDTALFDSGLAEALLKAFGHDTGIAVQCVPVPALPLLDALERGEFDAALSNHPDAESRLQQQGLAHDRQPIAGGEFVIVGPAPRARQRDPAGLAGGHDVAAALAALRDAAQAAPGTIGFLSAGDGSGTHATEQALWRRAKAAPAAPWYATAAAGGSLIAQARARSAYALVERGAWLAQGGAPLAVLVDADPLATEAVHVLRAFRVTHPAGRIFVAWIAGPKGRRVVAARAGYRVVAG